MARSVYAFLLPLTVSTLLGACGDGKSAEEILNLLVELQRGLTKTILMVTHDPRAAARAQRTLHLDKGQLVREAFAH